VPYITSASTAEAELLRGDRGVSHKLLNPANGCARLVVQVNVIHVGAAAGPYHYHTNADNIYYILEGRGVVTVEGRSYDIMRDDAILIYANERHSVTNVGDSDLRLIECKIPAESDFIIADD
jgi:mannose-6-phosphate isomerase-like protein (cupin superfamily)